MNVLIVEPDQALSDVWKRHLSRCASAVIVAPTQKAAVEALQTEDVAVIILDLMLPGGSALAVADFASYRQPDARIVFVTRNRFFSDGSIFNLIPNTAAYVPVETAPSDLAAIVEHHGQRAA
ncbi:MAG: response regulator [Pseudomonadota bacterium]